jgi:L-rhamnose mutarotase
MVASATALLNMMKNGIQAQMSRNQNEGEPMRRYCLTLNLKDDETAITTYKRYHQKIWPEIRDSIFAAGILDMEIYLLGRRLFMIMEVSDDFSFAVKAAADAANPKVQEWETLMETFQQPLPESKPGQKWVLMERIFSLQEQRGPETA